MPFGSGFGALHRRLDDNTLLNLFCLQSFCRPDSGSFFLWKLFFASCCLMNILYYHFLYILIGWFALKIDIFCLHMP